MPASSGVRLPFLLLQGWQQATRFSQADSPARVLNVMKTCDYCGRENEDSATVTVQLSNRGSRPETVYFRRELVTFEVSSVDGTATCDPGPDDRSPDRLAFTHLGPGRSLAVTSRLEEMCEKDTFARPGLYLVRARFDSDHAKSALRKSAPVNRAAFRFALRREARRSVARSSDTSCSSASSSTESDISAPLIHEPGSSTPGH